MTHTKGPWKLDQRSGCVAVYPANESHTCLSGSSSFAIHYSDKGAKFNGSFWDMDEEAKANAALIAAAPELLEALELCVAFCKGHQEDDKKRERYQKVIAAIAKAKGAING